MLTEQLLRRLWPHVDDAKPGLIAAVVASSDAVFAKYGLSTPLVVAHAMAQFSEEFGADMPAGKIEFEENLNYTAANCVRVWPSRFPSTASALPYAHNPQKLANNVYGSRMGNRPGTNDGWNFRGRGGSQVTGRDGYTKLAAKTGLDLLGSPDLVNDHDHFLECAVADFVLCGCLPFAERDDVRGVTHHLNGGYIGLAERERWLAKWKAALSATDVEKPKDGALRYGDKGWEVKAAQEQLTALGYYHGDDDGDFGSSTRAAVLAFQANEGLATDGVIGPATRDALAKAPQKPVAPERELATVEDLKDAGSQTVDQAGKVGALGKGAAAVGTVAAVEQSGALDQVKNTLNDLGGPHEAISLFQTVLDWMLSHWWIAALGAGFGAWYFGRNIVAARLADHRSGANMGR